ncbi:ribosomal protein S18-alanine N-acetyltransferase [Stenotrophomonas sp. BSUC-16]|jgi:[ribosomal protein S18]-alanine N-acetyltransferase|uniref:[Ribosomal protein bS18]-alanine N-acetyltransferase n=2 Tax=Stenotrophomonas TaxID=40323 RepID=A0A246KZQ8_9GAMM|nr:MULTISPECIES: ribosomal protein S18-alanine N-acetyltransferase [Stenotrophomonas]KXU88021.1 alanine acetyltransferase [Stenotrophomonas sp. DDT-1]MBA0274668.1 ribosomal-protein-alanine N-acetyltransferase [Stenotrophomonas maltophilia]MBC9078947.1 ribosomal protein S18-alanine N-acetyltransferase [Stenotrophomonas maltophilia]MBC9092898.1 ribosomal protein S18-alanine N-acetyltransferase [Stenotrophomonas maltophilia]MBH1390207.1 ribosomal protein S18-alanine N-acetyltransferase [Stenotrop
MSAVTRPGPVSLRALRESDLNAVMAIELRGYPFPWTRGIFIDCLRAGYPGLAMERDGLLVGYGVLSIAADEAHVLNICIDPLAQSRGLGRQLLRALVQLAADRGAQRVFLEVRPSNTPALALYHSEGFNEIGRRPRYYPAAQGREDAVVMAIELVDGDLQAMPPL